MMKKFTPGLKFLFCGVICTILISGTYPLSAGEAAAFIQETLTKNYDRDHDNTALKRYELNVTNTGFCRYKKFYNSGKTEYFAFNISSFRDMDYFGTAEAGQLHLYTVHDDVIVQTYNDKGGDIDSMGTSMIIPLKKIDADQLNLLHQSFLEIKKSLASRTQ